MALPDHSQQGNFGVRDIRAWRAAKEAELHTQPGLIKAELDEAIDYIATGDAACLVKARQAISRAKYLVNAYMRGE